MPLNFENKLEVYEELLRKWQKTINLVAPSTLSCLRQRHMEDSRQLTNYIPDNTKVLYDIGSGAGFPGMVLAMLCPDIEVTLIESDQRKCSFLRNVSRETETPATILNERIEHTQLSKPDLVTARALAPLEDLLSYMHTLNAPQGLFLKGRQAGTEIIQAKKKWDFTFDLHKSKTQKSSFVLCIKSLSFK